MQGSAVGDHGPFDWFARAIDDDEHEFMAHNGVDCDLGEGLELDLGEEFFDPGAELFTDRGHCGERAFRAAERRQLSSSRVSVMAWAWVGEVRSSNLSWEERVNPGPASVPIVSVRMRGP